MWSSACGPLKAEFKTKCKHIQERIRSKEQEEHGKWYTEDALRKSNLYSAQAIKSITTYCRRFPESLTRPPYMNHLMKPTLDETKLTPRCYCIARFRCLPPAMNCLNVYKFIPLLPALLEALAIQWRCVGVLRDHRRQDFGEAGRYCEGEGRDWSSSNLETTSCKESWRVSMGWLVSCYDLILHLDYTIALNMMKFMYHHIQIPDMYSKWMFFKFLVVPMPMFLNSAIAFPNASVRI